MPGIAIDVFVNHDAKPFGLSLSKPFDRLRANGNTVLVAIYETLNNEAGGPALSCQPAALDGLVTLRAKLLQLAFLGMKDFVIQRADGLCTGKPGDV